ncbi:hypothetical protein CANCADRAFT_110745 [Tortispora caseinolytica NRRL Y-17796]|uniref:Glucosamine 6-phosphate N-acetyltransferase n=1 Tax=Tortispora caseinolytica NRRL Y-17796 TaxID=767744 RepID=A0A1E4TG90_9ASCO|nr:hypothetical protein CANCADRAFT_110745 [Tortispora caseinolytica NRRL Y-17796]
MALFDASLISIESIECLPSGYKIRPIDKADFGAVEVLRVLTTVGDVTREAFEKVYESWVSHKDTYYVLVIENDIGDIVSVGSLIVEKKLIHNCGSIGHIEDIAVAKSEQGKKLGLTLIKTLTSISERLGCYKTILDCSENNIGFYEKCGFQKTGAMMTRRVEH